MAGGKDLMGCAACRDNNHDVDVRRLRAKLDRKIMADNGPVQTYQKWRLIGAGTYLPQVGNPAFTLTPNGLFFVTGMGLFRWYAAGYWEYYPTGRKASTKLVDGLALIIGQIPNVTHAFAQGFIGSGINWHKISSTTPLENDIVSDVRAMPGYTAEILAATATVDFSVSVTSSLGTPPTIVESRCTIDTTSFVNSATVSRAHAGFGSGSIYGTDVAPIVVIKTNRLAGAGETFSFPTTLTNCEYSIPSGGLRYHV